MSNPSLILPQSPAYGEDYVYAAQVEDGAVPLYNVLPLTFTRASGGTRINKDGLVQNMPYNLLQYSETFDNGYWNKGGASITANATTAPNGTTTADKFIESATLDTHQVYVTFVGNTGVSTLFIYAKKAERSAIQITSDQATDPSAIFNLDTGVIYSSANCTPFIESVGNGWYKCGITYTIDQTTSYPVFRVVDSSFNVVYTGNGTSGIYIWGAQLNIGSSAQPYLATTDRLNMPRITYPVGGGCGALLLEKQSTNLLPYSEQFDNAAWTKNGATITANTTISPDGTQNADTLTGASGNYRIYQIVGGLSSIDYTFSVFAKKGTANLIWLDFINVGDGPSFNFTTKAWSSASGWTTSYEEHANGWFRLIATKASNTTSAGLGIKVGAVNETVYIWGAQMEASSYATSYIPTTSTSATRIADACYKTGIGSLVSALEYTLFWQGSHIATGQYNSFMTVFQTSNQNNSARFYRNNSNNEIRAAIFNASNGLTLDLGSSVTTTRAKCALRVKNGDFALFVNGVKVNSNTTALAPSSVLDEINLQYFNNSQSFDQNCERACFYKTALSDTEAISLTTL